MSALPTVVSEVLANVRVLVYGSLYNYINVVGDLCYAEDKDKVWT